MKALLIFLLGFALVTIEIGNFTTHIIPWSLFDFFIGGISCGLGVYFKFEKKDNFLPYTMGFGIALVIGIILSLTGLV